MVALLEVRGVDVSFGGVRALRGVDLDVPAGRMTGLIGPNGAGKTTLFDVVTGLRPPDRGHVLLDGRDITRLATHRRARLGIARTFQRLEVFGSLTAKENVLAAAEMHRRWSGAHLDPPALTEEILDRVGIRAVAERRADELPTGMVRLVELGRALATCPRVLLLDEPASGLDELETAALAALVVALARDGTGILLVEHDVALVMEVCTEVYVLDGGAVLAEGPPADIQRDPAVLAAYLGTAPGPAPAPPGRPGRPA